jgi:hypothetical protein
MRATRALRRPRCPLVQKRAELLAHSQTTTSQYNLPEIGKQLADKANREGVEAHFPPPSVPKPMEVDLALLNHSDQILRALELYSTRRAKGHDGQTSARLHSVPGIGQILALLSFYELQASTRFPRGKTLGRMVPW